MSIWIFILLMVVTLFLRAKDTDLNNIVIELESEGDSFRKKEIARQYDWKSFWLLTLSIGSIFFYPYAIMFSLEFLFGLVWSYWFTFGVFIAYSLLLKPRRR